jgi:hypothetical protein
MRNAVVYHTDEGQTQQGLLLPVSRSDWLSTCEFFADSFHVNREAACFENKNEGQVHILTRLPGLSLQPAFGLVLRKYLELDIRSLCREVLCKKLRPMKQTEFHGFSL